MTTPSLKLAFRFFVICGLALSARAHSDHGIAPGVSPMEAIKMGNGIHRYQTVPGWGALPGGAHLGPTHGGVAVSKSGEVFVSTDGAQAISVFGPDGTFRRKIAPDCVGVHSLNIHEEDGQEYLYGAHLKEQRVVKLTLDGELVLEIKDTAEQPIEGTFKGLTAVAVTPDGRIVAAVGYGSNIIHIFSAEGKLLHSFGSKGSELEQFRAAHGVSLDTRFDEPRLLISDRENRRLKHYDLDGNLLGVHATNLRRPCAVSFWGDYSAVAELEGRVTILDKSGTPVTFLGDNPDRGQWANFKTDLGDIPSGAFTAPHGLSYDVHGNLFVQDWNQTGRITKLERMKAAPTTRRLFNGRNLDGWVIESGGQFSVENRILKLNAGKGWLRSADAFEDFVMIMEFRFLEDGANSGIFVRTSGESLEDEGGWPTYRYQVQCMNNLEGGNPIGMLLPSGVPPIQFHYDREAVRAALNPTGEWQTYRITVEGDTLTTDLNGVRINSVTGISHGSGHIGIQGEDGLLEFRRIEVTPLR